MVRQEDTMPQSASDQDKPKPLVAMVTAVAVTGALVAAVLAGFAAGVNSLKK